MRVVVAHFARGRSLVYMAGWLIACALLYGVSFYHPGYPSVKEYFDSKGLFRYQIVSIGWILGVLIIARQLTILNQLIFKRSEAVWVLDNKVFYLNFYSNFFYRAVRCSDIEGFALTTKGFLGQSGVAIQLRSGQEIIITTWLLSEPREVIASRLQALCRED